MRLSINSCKVNVTVTGAVTKIAPKGPPIQATIKSSRLKLSLASVQPMVVKVGIPGLPGPAGPPGPQGPAGSDGVDGVGIPETNWKFYQDLTPAPDGVETEFFLPGGDKARDDTPAGFRVQVYYNGQEIRPGASNDFIIEETGGAGTGFDKVTVNFTPKTGDFLWAHYVLI